MLEKYKIRVLISEPLEKRCRWRSETGGDVGIRAKKYGSSSILICLSVRFFLSSAHYQMTHIDFNLRVYPSRAPLRIPNTECSNKL